MPAKVATKICCEYFVDMGELLPEFWPSSREEDPHTKLEAKTCRVRSVQDIFMWLQCFGLYVSVLAAQHPDHITGLMAYQSTIERAHQGYTGLAWVC